MIKLIAILKEAILVNDKGEFKRSYNQDTTTRWAIYINDKEDWEILSNILEKKGYKFESGYTFSTFKKITDFNPFKSEREFGDRGEDDNDMGYSYAMSYKGVDDFILIDRPNKKLQIINPKYFNSRKNSTYKNHKIFNNLTDLINNI